MNAPPATESGLLALARGGRHHEFLNAGSAALAAGDDHAALLLMMARSLALLGLGGPARELLNRAKGHDDGPALRNDIDALRAMLVPIPTGRVPRNDNDEQYKANCAALVAAQPGFADVLAALNDAARDVQLFRTNDGAVIASTMSPSGLRQWNPGFYDPAAYQSTPLRDIQGGQPVLVVGLGADALLKRVMHDSERPAGEPGVLILVVEDDAARAIAWLHTMNIAPLVARGRLRAFLGNDAAAQLARFLAEHVDVELPSAAFVMQWSSRLNEVVTEVTVNERQRREQEFEEIVTRRRVLAGSRSNPDRAERLKPHSGAVVLGFTSRFTTMVQYSMRDIGMALEDAGCRFVLVREADEQRIHSSLTMARLVQEHDPALAIFINHFREGRQQPLEGVPVLTWIQDPTPTVLSRSTGEKLTALDFVCGYYVEQCTRDFGYPAERFYSMCLPVSSHLFHNAPLDDVDAARFGCDVMYVGHRHADADALLAEWRTSAAPALHPLLTHLRHRVEELTLRNELGDTRALVQHAAAELRIVLGADQANLLADYFVTRLHDIFYRMQTLRWTADWAMRTGRSFKLYGKGWANDPALAAFAVGPIEHGEPLRKAYRGARIVLQTIPAGFMHQRTFEGFASGSLVLARYAATSSAHMHFPEVDRVIFRDEQSLAEKLEHYLGDEHARSNVAAEMRDVVMREFTYSAVMPRLIASIRESLMRTS